MDEPGFDDILDDEQNDTQWYLDNMPQFQDAQLEQDPRGLILKQDKVPRNFLQRLPQTLDDENEEGYLTHKIAQAVGEKISPPETAVIIPRMPQNEERQVRRILEAKRRHTEEVDEQARDEPRKIIINEFSYPINEDSYFEVLDPTEVEHTAYQREDGEVVEQPMLISDPQFLRECTDEALYNEICDQFTEFTSI